MHLLVSLLLVSLLGVTHVAQAQEEEELLKAVYIYNFAKFTRWPDSIWREDQVLRLCSVGEDNLSGELRRLSGRAIQGHTVIVEQLPQLGASSNCQLLYIALSERTRYQDFVASLRDKPVLTVSEIQGFARSGGIIELYRDGEKIRFLINLAVARGAGLEISSRLLSLAEIIGMEEGP